MSRMLSGLLLFFLPLAAMAAGWEGDIVAETEVDGRRFVKEACVKSIVSWARCYFPDEADTVEALRKDTSAFFFDSFLHHRSPRRQPGEGDYPHDIGENSGLSLPRSFAKTVPPPAVYLQRAWREAFSAEQIDSLVQGDFQFWIDVVWDWRGQIRSLTLEYAAVRPPDFPLSCWARLDRALRKYALLDAVFDSRLPLPRRYYACSRFACFPSQGFAWQAAGLPPGQLGTGHAAEEDTAAGAWVVRQADVGGRTLLTDVSRPPYYCCYFAGWEETKAALQKDSTAVYYGRFGYGKDGRFPYGVFRFPGRPYWERAFGRALSPAVREAVCRGEGRGELTVEAWVDERGAVRALKLLLLPWVWRMIPQEELARLLVALQEEISVETDFYNERNRPRRFYAPAAYTVQLSRLFTRTRNFAAGEIRFSLPEEWPCSGLRRN